ncbi:MAG: YraN family protein [Bacteroidetes bacterium]|nr:YraN family protein [Bacteroidota bacterium]
MGLLGEELAVRHLEDQGYTILERRYRFRNGEVDIVARHNDQLIFVEVKTVNLRNRKMSSFGEPESWVTRRKQTFLIASAQHYLWKNKISEVACRFDVITVRLQQPSPAVNHLIDAFRP